ncbi:MAG: hypothetical protein H6817_07700 [Phycisphaerales bacterium]|nr:hypothetical protein [Phycisphaerales bacterium]
MKVTGSQRLSGLRGWVIGGCVVLVSVAGVSQAWAADESNAKVEACGLRVVGKGYGSDNDALRAFNWYDGVSVALLVTAPDGGLIEFDRDASEVKALTDDKGTNLLVQSGYSFPGFTGSNEVSPDGKALLVEVNGGGVPAKGATSIKAKGTIAISGGSKQQAFKSEKVAVKEDATIKAGEVSFKITGVGEPDWGDMPQRIDIETTDKTDAIAGIKFLDAAGAEIESSRSSSMTMQMGDTRQVTYSYNLSKKVEEVTVEITYWTDLRKLVVPFDVTVQVGL